MTPTEDETDSDNSWQNIRKYVHKLDLVESLLASRRWVNQCLRVNIVTPEKIKQYPSMKVAICESNLLQLKETQLRDSIKAIAPQWWGDDDTRVTLNRNVCCERHKDSNKAHSWIMFLGDFVGGALVFDDGVRVDEKYTWHRINGQTHH